MIIMDKKAVLAAQALLCMQRHSWEQGLAMQAFFELGDWQIVEQMAYDAVSRAAPDGRVATIGVTDDVTDPCAAGEALYAVAVYTKKPYFVHGEKMLRHWAFEQAPRSAEGIVYHLIDKQQFWADSFYMLPPYLAAVGAYEEAIKQWYGYWNALYDTNSRLMNHVWDAAKGGMARSEHWGTGNGWTLAGAARLIAMLPEQMQATKKDLIQKVHTLLDTVLSYRAADGSFHNILDDPAAFREINLCQMTAYTIYRGIGSGWLPFAHYFPIAEGLRNVARQEMDRNGFIHSVCGAPKFDQPGISPEAQAFFLLVEAVRSKIVSTQA